MTFIFIDESGDLGNCEGCSRHIILAALVVDNQEPLKRIIKNMRRHKFRKQLRVFSELKANNLKDEIISYALLQLNAVPNATIFYMILEKKKLYSEFLKNDRHKLYNFIAGKLAKNLPLNCASADIRVDKSKGKQMLQEDFNTYFEKCLREKSKVGKVTIQHSYSHAWHGLQFADLLAWAAFQKVEKHNSYFIDLIKIPQETYSVW